MKSPDADEIDSLVERGRQSVQAARDLVRGGYTDIAASRAYYAAFYAATAALLAEGLSFSKHSGVLAAVHRDLVNPGKLSTEQGRIFNRLFELRGVADYGIARYVSQQDASDAIDMAESFVREVIQLLSRLGQSSLPRQD